MTIDITFDFRRDARGKDPGAFSPMLVRYHHLLWSRPLPSGAHFELRPRTRAPYALYHESELGRFELTSDAALPTFTRRPDMQSIIGQLPPGYAVFLNAMTYTIGGMILWPCNQIDRKWTINQARGFVHRIADRLDLTVECIRRHYEGDTSHPLADVFGRYCDFFELFESFDGYIDFWLLHDLIGDDGSVRLFLPSENFAQPSLPRTAADYLTFAARTVQFVMARNRRIDELRL